MFMLFSFWAASGLELGNPEPVKDAMSSVMLWVYRIACLTLSSLNAFWFYKMLLGAVRVFGKSRNVNLVEEEIKES